MSIALEANNMEYQMKKREHAKYLYYKDFEAEEFLTPNPSEFMKYTEKDMVSKAGKKFTAKTYMFKDTVTGQLIGVPHCGLLQWHMDNYREGDILQVQYMGKQDDDDAMSPHQVEVYERELVGGESASNPVDADDDLI